MSTRILIAFAAAALITPGLASAQPKKALTAGIIEVPGSHGINLVNKHGSDVRTNASPPGQIDVEFDRVENDGGIVSTFLNNTMELEITVDGVLQPMIVQSFDILNGTVDVERDLGLTAYQNVWITRLDLYDQHGERFATMGAKIRN